MTPEALAVTHLAAFGAAKAWSATTFAKLLTDEGITAIGDAQSYVIGRLVLDEAEILTLATDPALQGQGLATKTLSKFLVQIQAKGVARVFLEVAQDNQPALALYSRAGFAQVGERKNYYARPDAPPVTGLILRRDLP